MDDLDFELDDSVMFELPTLQHVEAFSDRFRPHWEGWSDPDERGWLFTARLQPQDDVALLLREAQELLAELGIAEIRFYLDGRVYVLDAARTALVADFAASSK